MIYTAPEAPGLPPELVTEEAALTYLEELAVKAADARLACNVIIPDARSSLALEQKRRFEAFLVRYGHALGACDLLLRCRKISPIAYNSFIQRIRLLMLSSMASAGLNTRGRRR